MFNRFCRSVRKLFGDNILDNSSTDEGFKDCEEFLAEVVVVQNEDIDDNQDNHNIEHIDDIETIEDIEDIDDNEDIDNNEDNVNVTENSETNHRLDWNDIQELESDSFCSSSLRSSMAKQSLKIDNCSAKPIKDFNRLLEKWGESVGIFDEQTEQQKRLVRLSELNNFFELKLSSMNSSDCVLLCSLINGRYPRFYTSTVNYYQRWRMRYNIFVVSDALIVTEEPPVKAISAADSVADIGPEQLVLHIGEIHLYFDVVPKYLQPVYVNSSFYSNKNPINSVANVVLNPNVMTRISRIVNSIRYSKDIFQFKFPLNEELFYRKNYLFDKFVERQTELIDETVKVFRKEEQKNKKLHNWSQKQIRYRQRVQTRDQFAYDYDSRHMSSQEYGFNNQNNYFYYRQKTRNEPKVSTIRSVNQTMAPKTYHMKTYYKNNRDNQSNMEWMDSSPQNR